jgi:hypothetical protein
MTRQIDVIFPRDFMEAILAAGFDAHHCHSRVLFFVVPSRNGRICLHFRTSSSGSAKSGARKLGAEKEKKVIRAR